MMIPTHWLFKLPIAKDRVRFLRLYATFGLCFGLFIGLRAHHPTYVSKPFRPSIFYKLHLKRLLYTKKITQEQYDKYINYS
uniref:Conserved plasmodium protein n=1 Tax=Babesia bovis TaxID=5865 RepID=S6BKP6_BABBO|nr:conserved plasmodium protein [Babesia bovis]